jgi:hypothetical protein
MNLLVRNAHLGRWRETIVMAAGRANESQRRELIDGILRRVQSQSKIAREFKLLAVACLETLPSVPDDLRTVLDRCMDELIPPGNLDEARLLAVAGEPVLRRLPAKLEGLPDNAARASVHTAWLINGPEAPDVLRRYAADARRYVQRELNEAWDYFDPSEYAERVLAVFPPGGQLSIRSPAQLAAVTNVAPLSALRLYLPQPANLGPLRAHAASLRSLFLECTESPHDLAIMPELPVLRSLVLHVPGLTDLGFLNSLRSLTSVVISYCADIGDYLPLRRSTALETLRLDDSGQLRSLDQLPPLGKVTDLSLRGSRLGRGALSALVSASPKVRRLHLDDCDWVDDLAPVTALPQLEELSITDIAPGTDLSPLIRNKRVHVWIAPGQDVRGADALGDRLSRV